MGKVLVADDSSTIQKVVRITLANEPFQLIECMDEDELNKVLPVNEFNLVLLDFNLSNSKTGFQLGAEVKEKCPGAKVMAMLGTFDTVDPAELVAAGIDDSIVKPFESDVFISKCRALIESEITDGTESIEIPLEIVTEDESPLETEILDNWEVNSPDIISDQSSNVTDEIVMPPVMQNSDPLASELESWSMEVPGVIDGSDTGPELPPVIKGSDEFVKLDLDSTSPFDLKKFEDTHDQAIPEEGDLAYPDNSNVEDMSEEEILAVGEIDPFSNMSTEMVSLDDLEPDAEEEEDDELISFEAIDEGNPEILEKDIEDDNSDDDIWEVDEDGSISDQPIEESGGGIETNLHLAEEVSFQASEEVLSDDDIENELISDPLFEEEVSDVQEISIDTTEIVEQLKEALTPMIEKIVKEQCAQVIERVAWEVIPDLAENLVKKEIRSITDSID